MTKHGSASPRKQESRTLDANLKRRARKLATDSRVDPRTRSLIRYGLEIKEPYLEQIVNRVESGEMSIDHIHLESDEKFSTIRFNLRHSAGNWDLVRKEKLA